MFKYTLIEQRNTFYESLRCDGVLKYQFHHFDYFDQLGAIGKIPFWDNIAIRFLFNVFLLFGLILGDLCLLLMFIVKVSVSRKKITFERIFVCKEERLFSIANRIGLLLKEDVWFSSPFDSYSLQNDAKQVTTFDCTTIMDVLRCFIQSIIIHFSTVYHLGYNYLFLSFNAYNWCMMDMALRHIPENVDLYYSNICDRVAIMIDKLPHRNKNMIQHGTMHFFNNTNSNPYMTWQEDKGFWIWNSLYKSSPSKVYCFTKDDEIALRRSVISNNPEFIYIGYDFHPAFKSNSFSLLIIGMYTLLKDYEEEVIKQLQGLDIDIYLKNHPSITDDNYDELRKKYNFIFLEGRISELPAVDLVISYDSTLALEYASIGTKVLYYGHFDINDIRSVVTDAMNL